MELTNDSEDNVTEKSVEDNFKQFRAYLEQNVQTVDLIAFFTLFEREQKVRFRQVSKNDPLEATRLAFDTIEKMDNQPGRYMHLLHAIEDAALIPLQLGLQHITLRLGKGYPKLVLVLKGQLVPFNDVHRRQINSCASEIFQRLQPTSILPNLLQRGILSDNDVQQISATERNDSTGAAAMDLIHILPSRSKHWFMAFIEALVECNNTVLAESIDPELTRKIQQHMETGLHVSLADYEESLMPRHLAEREASQVDEVYGDPVSMNNLNAPNFNEKVIPLENFDEFLEEQSGLYVNQQVNKSITRRQPIAERLKNQPRSQSPEMLALKSLERQELDSLSDQIDQTSISEPQSPECNISMEDKRLHLDEEETSPKLLYLRAPPDGSENIYEHDQYSNKTSSLRSKEMKDKSVPNAVEDMKDNLTMNVAINGSLDDLDKGALATYDDIPDEDISLRDYQKELAEPAIRGSNVLIVAPTGSGKTRVALKIIQEHMRKVRGQAVAKVIFLVNQVALANQQAEACMAQLKKYSTKVISGDTQRAKGECLKDFVDKRDIMVVTAQVLLDALVRKDIDSITKFSLMIFDECHHTHANHPFNQIMSMYVDLKLSDETDKSALPQIVGLTASVGVGKAKDVGKAMQHIKSLMANLDSEIICTVQNNMSELRKFVNVPDEETCTVPKRQNDIFGRGVTKLMETIEKRMSTSPLVTELDQAVQFESTLRAPAEKGTAQYTQWLSKLWKETAKLRNQETRRFLNPCRAHLEYYNNALIIYNDARVEDALKYLSEMMKRWKENAVMNDNETVLDRYYEATKRLPFDQNSSNPKLEKLQEMILRAYRGEEKFKNSRGIVFVKTRDLATAIVSWMNETPGLKQLNAIKFVGQNESADKGGMTKVEQDDALKYFKDGKHKLIIATSVAEEGLDIRKCNLVIRYDHVTNEIAMVQSRGRGRAEDSKYVVVAEEGKGMAEKEELNMIREILMRKAIIKLQDHIWQSPKVFREERLKLQEDAKLDRDLQAIKRKGKRIRCGEFELRCLRCNDFICMSSDVKKIENAHHVCVDESLKDRVDYVRGSTRYIDDTIQTVGKLICVECGFDLGGIIKHKGLEFPVLKIEKYLVVDMNERHHTCKQWKQAPFEPTPLSTADFKVILQKRKDLGEI